MNHSYFSRIASEIHRVAPFTSDQNFAENCITGRYLQEDLPRLLRPYAQELSVVFEDFLIEKKALGDITPFFRIAYGANYYKSNAATLIMNVYPAFIKASLAHDPLADETIDIFSIKEDFVGSDYFSEDSFFNQKSFLYRINGEIRGDEFLSLCAKNHAIKATISEIIRVDDVEALIFCLENDPFKSKLAGTRLNKILTGIEVSPESKCFQKIFKPKSDSPYSYLTALLNCGKNTSIQTVNNLYKSSMAKVVGQDYIFSKLVEWCDSEAERLIFKKLIQDGADWYCGFKQVIGGHHHIYSAKQSVLSQREKMDELVKKIPNILSSHALHEKRGLACLINSFGFEDWQPSVKTASDAERLYKLTSDTRYLALCSNKVKRNNISKDLDI